MKRLMTLFVLAILPLASIARAQATVGNNSSCDLSVTPAATLLVPYFEVDLTRPPAEAMTTIFTVVNTSADPQIANVTVWTDWAYPVLTFDAYLTGYDIQSINLRDLLIGGALPSTNSTAPPGPRSHPSNPQFNGNARTACFPLGGTIPPDVMADVRTALTAGVNSLCGAARIGATHANAMGYITIDVVATCAPTLPAEETYYTRELLFDNVLIGDYAYIDPNPTFGNYAGASPMVHIRALPEGGNAGQSLETNLPYTFYDRYTPRAARRIDRRQPLPSTFAARYIQGGTGGFATNFVIWREGVTGATAACDEHINDFAIPYVEAVRLDSRENATVLAAGCVGLCRPFVPTHPATTATPSSSSTFPPLTSGDVAGWMYLNLNNGGSKAYSVAPGHEFPKALSDPRPSQNWVVVNMYAEGRYSTLADAASLGNGCSSAPPVTTASQGTPIQAAPNVTP